MTRRVAITGIGVISALGHSRAEFWEALRTASPGIAPIEGIDRTQLRCPNGAEVRGFDPLRHFEARQADLLDRFAQFAVVAAREAVADAGVQPEGSRTAVVTGCCVGGQATEDAQFLELYGRQTGRVHPMTIPRIMSNAGASAISIEMKVTGPVFSMATACSSANHALGHALWMIRSGMADLAIAGGSEALFSLGFLKAWEAMRVVAPDTCRPFSSDRKGLILGEGGAMLVLEPLEVARARGAHVYAELCGFGMSADASHLTQPGAEGPAAAMRAALEDAGMDPREVGYINAHGTATQSNDPAECRAIHTVFGSHAANLAVSSTKSMHGHALGAAGALEAAATALALRHGVLPPTANFTRPDPTCDLDVIPNTARVASVRGALSNSFAFGGLNAVLAFRSPALP